jgi:hypothetical protein
VPGAANNYTCLYVNGSLNVTPREATVGYIGQTLFVTSGSSSTTAQVTLTASVIDPTVSGGSVANATVTFTDLLSGKILASGVKVSLVANTGTGTGTANTVVTLSSGQYGAQEYLIQVSLGSSYKNLQQTTAPADSDAYKAANPVVTVMIPATANTLQGNGTIAKLEPSTAAGVYGIGTVRSYTMGMKYNKSGANLQGQIELILDMPDGEYYIKSNSISSAAFSNPILVDRNVTVYTKASIYKVDQATGKIVAIDGGVTLRMDAHDGGANTSADSIGFTVLSGKDSSLYYSNNWIWDSPTLSYRTVKQSVITGTQGAAVQIN